MPDDPEKATASEKSVKPEAEGGETGADFGLTSLDSYRYIIVDSVTNVFAPEFGTIIFSFKGANIDVNKRVIAEINS